MVGEESSVGNDFQFEGVNSAWMSDVFGNITAMTP